MVINWNRGLLMNQAGAGGGGGGGQPIPTGAVPNVTGGVAAPVTQPSMAGNEGTPPPLPPADPAPAPAPAPAAPEGTIQMTGEQMSDRLHRDRQAQLQRMGFDNEEQLLAMQARDRAATEAAETARREQMTREQTLQEDVDARTAERDNAIEEANQLRFSNHVASICASVGVRNLDYATHMVEREANGLPEGQELDVEAFLRERVDPENAEHAATRAAFGIEVAPTQTAAPATTTGTGNAPPTPPPAGGDGTQTDDAMEMTEIEWARKKESLGLG